MKYQSVIPTHFMVESYFSFITKNFDIQDVNQLDDFVLFVYSNDRHNINTVNAALVQFMAKHHPEKFQSLCRNNKTQWMDARILCMVINTIVNESVTYWDMFLDKTHVAHEKFAAFQSELQDKVKYDQDFKSVKEELIKVLGKVNSKSRIQFDTKGVDIEDLVENVKFDEELISFYVSKKIYEDKNTESGKVFILGNEAVAGGDLVKYHLEGIGDE
jgi:hypothetical protein